MSELFNKEFTMMTDSTVDTLYFGALPSEGRYFVKKCERLSPGNFRVNVKVAKGDLYYHYRTSDDWSRVLLDPNNMQIGAKNWHSICRIGTTGFNTIEFDQTNSYISRLDNNQIEIKIVSHQEWIKAVDFVYVGSDGTKEIPMECTLDAKSRKYFKLIINLHDIPGNSYVFAVSCKNGDKLFYNANKQLTKEIVETFYDDFSRLPMYPAKSIGPVYQIFPDSFATSGDVNDCGRNVIKRSERPQSSAFYGGNIRGIIDKIDYIVNLGIKCVYLTPIFEANSNDRYDCIDYKSIDPMLGTKEDFKELCDLLHKHGIKLVLDIVLNHCGTDFWMFKDLLNKQEESEYRNYFEVTDYPVEFREYFPNYSSWWGNGKMPQFNLNNEEVVNYLFACCKYWIDEFGIDGWRIDVSSELKHELLKRFRKEMLDEKEDLVIIGENWKDARSFLEGDELDGVTNYLCWWKAFYPFFCTEDDSIAKLALGLYESYFCYAHNRSLSNWNVIGSHDVARFYSHMHNTNNIESVIAIQMFLPGNPVVYYGDELRMEGEDNPDNRQAPNWDNLDLNDRFLTNYTKMLRLRCEYEALREGAFAIPYYDEVSKVLVLSRMTEKERIYEVINFSDTPASFDLSLIDTCSQVMDLCTGMESLGQNISVKENGFRIVRTSGS